MAIENKYIVYKHINSLNGKVYIGITSLKNPNDRWCGGKGYKNNLHFWRSIQKYGWNNFKHEILYFNLTKDEAEKYEIKLIKSCESTDKLYGYNIQSGGSHNGVHSEETKEKIRNSLRGRKRPPEVIEKLRITSTGRQNWLGKKHTEATKQKISKKLKGRESNRKGVILSKETKMKISETKKRKKDGAKKVRCLTTDKVFDSILDAAVYYNIKSYSHISGCCLGKRKTCGKLEDGTRLKWEYI